MPIKNGTYGISGDSGFFLAISFVKESEEVVVSHKRHMDDEIKSLIPTECSSNKVTHELKMTMIDAESCTNLSEARSNATCYLCLSKPSQMNRLDCVSIKTESDSALEFGLSSLHARINTMECLLHIAYRLDFKKWAARVNEHKTLLEKRKKYIQDIFKDELNLLIGFVTQDSGTTVQTPPAIGSTRGSCGSWPFTKIR